MDLLGNDISIDDVKSVPDDCEFALESILAEFGDDGAPVFCPPPSQPEELSLPIIMDEDEGVLSAELGSADEPVSTPVHVPEPLMAENKDQEPEAPAPKAETEKQVSQEDKDVRIYRIGKTGAPFVSQSPSMPEQPEDEPEQPESPHDEPDDGEAGNEDEDGSDETKPPFVRSGEENNYEEVGLG
ncbi:MAG: hypothetical protein EOM14_07035, partial [Clostridia bacterium]|nr:hypothetical protein [Clostridia bacterium]